MRHVFQSRAPHYTHAVLVLQEPGLWKADIDGAFRRIPVRPEHRWATAVAYVYRGAAMTSTHNGMPFGASSSVVAWHRVGEVLAHIARRWAFLRAAHSLELLCAFPSGS